jgi:hypothetical protein
MIANVLLSACGGEGIFLGARFRSTFSGSGDSEHTAGSGRSPRRISCPWLACCNSLASMQVPDSKGRRIARGTCDGARNALHAWACALRALGTPLQPWRSRDTSPGLPPLLDEYCRYRRAHNGIAESTLHRDIETAQGFLAQLRQRRKPVDLATLADVDAFVQKVATRVSRKEPLPIPVVRFELF